MLSQIMSDWAGDRLKLLKGANYTIVCWACWVSAVAWGDIVMPGQHVRYSEFIYREQQTKLTLMLFLFLVLFGICILFFVRARTRPKAK